MVSARVECDLSRGEMKAVFRDEMTVVGVNGRKTAEFRFRKGFEITVINPAYLPDHVKEQLFSQFGYWFYWRGFFLRVAKDDVEVPSCVGWSVNI